MARQPYFKNPAVEHAAAKVYKDGFPIYMMVSKLKKELKRTDPFPYFIKTFQMVSADWHANQQQSEHAAHKKQPPIAQSVKDVLKGMFG